jgi:DNA polymerase I
MSNDLIFGKGNIDNIVSVEIDGDKSILFRENLEPIEVPNKYWILSPSQINKKFNRLKGDLYFKYGWQTTDREEFMRSRFWWKKHDIFSVFDPKEAFMINWGHTYFKGMKHSDVSVLSFDIESTSLEHNDSAKVLIISNTFRKNGSIKRKLFCYDEYPNEGKMIDAWCDWVRENNPSVIIGHNIYTYDLPYLNFIASKYGTSLLLGRNASAIKFNARSSKFRKDQTQSLDYFRPHIYGRELVDTMFLSIKYDIVEKKYESYALKKIIAHEGLEVEDRQHYDAAKIRDNYTIPEEWEKIKKYALHDADDALALYDLMIPPYFYLTQSVPKSFQQMIESASGSQINAVMCRAYLQQAHSLPKATDVDKFQGAISYGVPGIYRNAFKIDIASLYPSIMIQHKVCDRDKDPLEYFPKLVETFTEKRFYHKELMATDQYHDDLQKAYKIFINSCYGFLGTRGLLFNSPKNAAFITETGRNVLVKAIEWAEGKSYDDWKTENNLDEEDNQEPALESSVPIE